MKKIAISLWASLAIARLDMKETLGRATSVFILLFSACMSLVVFYLVLSDAGSDSSRRIVYLLPGLIATLSLGGMASISSKIQSDKHNGTLVMLLLSPSSPRVVFIGHLISFVTQILVQSLALVVITALLVGKMNIGSFQALLGAFAAIIAGAMCFGSIGASIALLNPFPGISQIPIMIIMTASIIGSTAFFSIQHVPGMLKGFARINPISYMCEVMRFGICLECTTVDWSRLGILLLQTATAWGIACIAAGRLEHRADL